jgi:hypothetical protein
MRPHVTMAAAAVFDLVAAAALYSFGFRGFAVFMVAVAIAGFVIAYVMWKRSG